MDIMTTAKRDDYLRRADEEDALAAAMEAAGDPPSGARLCRGRAAAYRALAARPIDG